jgi:hypothetical protein
MVNRPSDEHLLGLSGSLASELIYRLCVAECTRLGFKLAEIDKLENPTTPGNWDIRVALPLYAEKSDYIPNPQTIIFVKASYMPLAQVERQEIYGEYFDTFAPEHGAAYIIASTRQKLDSSRTIDYQQKMPRELPQQSGQAKGFDLDPRFYSRGKIRQWLAEHTSVQSWLLQTYASTERKISTKGGGAPKNVIYSKRLQRPS